MKTKIITIIIAALSVVSAPAQQKSITDYSQVALGKCADGSDLKFYFIPSEGNVEAFRYSSTLPFFSITDDKGTRVFNSETMQQVGSFNQENRHLGQFVNDGFLAYTGKGFFGGGHPAYYRYNGDKVWSKKTGMVLCDGRNDVVVCNRGIEKYNFAGYNLQTGEEIWRHKFTGSRHSQWDCVSIDPQDKRYYYLISDSLIRLDIKTGNTVSHAFTAGVYEPLNSILNVARRPTALPANKGIARDLINSYNFGMGTLTGTHSNIIFSGDSLFVADADSVFCFDKSLNVIWRTPLPEKMGAKSEIRLDGNDIILQNYGLAFQQGCSARYGKPFISSYKRSNGQLLGLQYATFEKKLRGGMLIDGRSYWQTAKGFYYMDEGDTTLTHIPWKPETSYLPIEGEPDYGICDTVWVAKDGKLESVPTNHNQLVVEIYGRDVNVISPDGSCKLLPASQVYFHYTRDVYSTNNGEDNMNDYVIIDPSTHEIKYTFHNDGAVLEDYAGNIFVTTKQGIGLHKKTE